MNTLIIGDHIEAYPHEENKLNIYNRNTSKTFILGEKESAVFKCINGANTIDDIQKKCPFYSKLEIEKLIESFSQIGLFEKQKKRFNPLKIKVRLFNPNKLLKENSFITKALFYAVTVGMPLLFAVSFLVLRFVQPDSQMILNLYSVTMSGFKVLDWVIVLAISLFCLAMHEMGHMITARYYGVNVPEIGVMLYFLMPCAYTNISGINLLKSRKERLVVLLAGSLVNLGIVGICIMVISLCASQLAAAYSMMVMGFNMTTIFLNCIIFLKFDGYYMAEVILDEPKLREKAMLYLTTALKLAVTPKKKRPQAKIFNLKDEKALLSFATYIGYALISSAYIPVILLNTVLPVILR